ncbi:FAD-binding oxidoreductase [Desulfitobacterium sp.]|uniref:FAD-binding oxidoreductase n=1 Tax=Desulfitobacterium sp. TaxID=49981 RepID=UPI002B1E9E00|nr:FAD-binding oxidoreductase [Desulfitobacterium sp.]MEA4901577.1 FAD-binding oxidoreductase [Desulfitobacterium sp.]
MDNHLSELLCNRITDDWWERVTYGRDLAEVPGIMRWALRLETIPDLVARPQNTEEVAALAQYAYSQGIPIIPRGSGSSAFFNSVPVKKGITIDLSGISGILNLDEKQEEVTVGAGQRWEALDKALRQKGWAVRSYPSSAPTATIGGWLNMEGYGIGSLAFGPLSEQVVRLEVVLPDGTIKEVTQASEPAISWFAGSDGTLGLVTKVTLKIRHAPDVEGHWLLSFKDVASLSKAAATVAEEANRPYNLGYYSAHYFDFFRQLGYPAPHGEILAVDYEGNQETVQGGQKIIKQLAGTFGAEILPTEVGVSEWKERFYHMRIKRLGPTLMAAEDWIGVNNLSQYQDSVARLGSRMRTKFYSYGTIVNSQKMTMFTAYRADSRQGLGYIVAMAVTGRLHQLAINLGGHPYSVGLWNTPYLPSIFSKVELAKLKKRKKELDPKGLLNPGKHYTYPSLLPPWFFSFGTRMASLLQRYTGAREKE